MLTNDHWTLDLAGLAMDGTGDELARLALRCRPPYAVCVQGKWGCGKTSLMRYAMARLGGEPLATTLRTSSRPTLELPPALAEAWNDTAEDAGLFIEETLRPLALDPPVKLSDSVRVVPIWFNPWQHQNSELPVVALLQELRAQFTHLVKAGRFAKKLAQVSVEAGLTILGELLDAFASLQGGPKTGLGKTFAGVRKVGEAYERRHFEGLPDAQRINLLFEAAVERLLAPDFGRAMDREKAFLTGRDGHDVALRRLVIFIDDLDRCSEEQTVRLLEAIKLYLQTRNCVFVFGMDGTAARRAVRSVLPHKSLEETQEYLEKLFQAVVHVPLPRGSADFVAGLLEPAGLDGGDPPLPAEELASRIVRLIEPNPRKLKNFIGSLAVAWRIHRDGGTAKAQLSDFLLLTYLQTNHPDVARLLAYSPEEVQGLHRMILEIQRGAPFWPGASPVEHFFSRAFRHTFEKAFWQEEGISRKDIDEVTDELIDRLDRYKGDRAFIELWMADLGKLEAGDVERRLTPILKAAVWRAEGEADA